MKVLVTGASGFLGRYVVEELLRREISVVAVSRSIDDQTFPASRNLEIHRFDISHNCEGMYDAWGKPDVLVHLAWGGLPHYKSMDHLISELPMQMKFIQTLVDQGLKNLICIGTCFEYGLQNGPLHAYDPTKPNTSYGLAKDTLRKYITLLKEERGFSFTWARLFYMYGEGQSPSSLFFLLKKAIQEGRSFFDMSYGDQIRDYLTVEQVARKITNIATDSYDEYIVNICSGSPISIRRLVECWCKDYGWDIDLRFGKKPYADYEPLAFWGVPS